LSSWFSMGRSLACWVTQLSPEGSDPGEVHTSSVELMKNRTYNVLQAVLRQAPLMDSSLLEVRSSGVAPSILLKRQAGIHG
jgi:hypothetical protein